MSSLEKIKFVESISSTNTYLKENYFHLENMFSICSKHQTNGKGRLGRTWNDDDDLLMSILLKDELQLEKIEEISLLICASIFKALSEEISGLKIKWPNDILLNGKKICGILLESVVSDKLECLVIGFGINVNTKKFPDDLKNKATSLLLETNHSYNIKVLAEKIYSQFTFDYEDYKKGKKDYLKVCKENSCLLDKEITYLNQGVLVNAKVIDILSNGHILLESDGKQYEKSSGEITLHYSYYSNIQND